MSTAYSSRPMQIIVNIQEAEKKIRNCLAKLVIWKKRENVRQRIF